MKNIRFFLSENVHCLVVKFSVYLNRHVFVMFCHWMLLIPSTFGALGRLCFVIMVFPAHDKTNKMACAPSKDSDLPGHPPSLIRVFALRSMGS